MLLAQWVKEPQIPVRTFLNMSLKPLGAMDEDSEVGLGETEDLFGGGTHCQAGH